MPLEGSLSGGSLLNSGPAWALKQVPYQPGLFSKTLCSSPIKRKDERKKKIQMELDMAACASNSSAQEAEMGGL